MSEGAIFIPVGGGRGSGPERKGGGRFAWGIGQSGVGSRPRPWQGRGRVAKLLAETGVPRSALDVLWRERSNREGLRDLARAVFLTSRGRELVARGETKRGAKKLARAERDIAATALLTRLGGLATTQPPAPGVPAPPTVPQGVIDAAAVIRELILAYRQMMAAREAQHEAARAARRGGPMAISDTLGVVFGGLQGIAKAIAPVGAAYYQSKAQRYADPNIMTAAGGAVVPYGSGGVPVPNIPSLPIPYGGGIRAPMYAADSIIAELLGQYSGGSVAVPPMSGVVAGSSQVVPRMGGTPVVTTPADLWMATRRRAAFAYLDPGGRLHFLRNAGAPILFRNDLRVAKDVRRLANSLGSFATGRVSRRRSVRRRRA